jgi:rRNA-processing protein FCF1
VDSVQGLTIDFCYYFAFSDKSPAFSFKINRFNVATSRARYCTLILLDEVYKVVQPYKGLVAEFISKCEIDNAASVPVVVEDLGGNESNKSISPSIKVIDKIDLSKFEKPKKEIIQGKENIYIIDTNVFVDYPDIISKIDKKDSVVLSAKVIDELDYLKISLTEEQKRNVQKALKYINESIDKRGIKMEIADASLLPEDFNKKSPDNLILSVALRFREENPIILTSDNGLQIKAKGLGITTITLKEFLKQVKY